jgi:hypothetical protein
MDGALSAVSRALRSDGATSETVSFFSGTLRARLLAADCPLLYVTGARPVAGLPVARERTVASAR